MADLVFKNFAYTTLAADIAAGDTTITVADGNVFPDAPGDGEFVAVLEDVLANREIVRCTSRTGNLLTVTRAQENTPAQAFATGDIIELRYTAASMDEYFARRGYDGGYWQVAGGGGSRLSWQVRRNLIDVGDEPDDMYEGELAANLANDTPLLFVGPAGAVNNGVGIPIIPLVLSAAQPANPYDRLLWYNETTKELRIYDESQGAFRDILVNDVTTSSQYAQQSQVDNIQTDVNNLKVSLTAPAGTKMLFVQSTVPAGWVQDTTHNDRMIRVTSGTGGGIGGSWGITGLSVGGHSLTLAEMPAHDHGGGIHNHPNLQDIAIFSASGYGGDRPNQIRYQFSPVVIENSAAIITTQGSGAAHTHPVSGDTSSWRPSYVDAVLGTKS